MVDSTGDRKPDVSAGMYGQRPSRSADAAKRVEFQRMAAMDPWERMVLALALGHRARLLRDEGASSARDENREPHR